MSRGLLLLACLLVMSAFERTDVTAEQRSTTALEPIRYVLRFPDPHTHHVDVEATVPAGRSPAVDLFMAVWTPGSYLVREYSRHVVGLKASGPDGAPLEVSKTRKNRWRVTTGGATAITIRYRVYGREMTVRNNWIEAGFAMLNGAPTFITLVESAVRPHDVRLELPPAWRTSVTGLPPAPGGAPHHYLAPDFDTLVDSPIVTGNPAVYPFEVSGRPLALVNVDEQGVWDGPRSARDTEAIVLATERLWGSLPFDRYYFLNVMTGAGGGLEHKTSTLLMTSRWRTRNRTEYLGWLGLVSHEFFHTWNGKRLRPAELGPFDYEQEVYTPNLWVYEGFTDYYGDLIVRRAGLSSDEEYLRELSNLIRGLQTTPGRLEQSAAGSSFDTWIRQYRPDENSPNVAISYYTKGGVIAFLLDAKVRAATGGSKSLDDVMRLAYARYSGARGYATEDFRRTASEVAGADLTAWFDRVADSTAEVEYGDALSWFGLRFKPGDSRDSRPWLGATTRVDGGRLLVSQVRRGTPAHAAGLNVDDEIVGIDEFRVAADRLQERLDRYRPGDSISVLVARREQLQRFTVVLGSDPGDAWTVEADPSATPDQIAHREAWLVTGDTR
jgi:predicted metalloprotease with PDZ domain